MVLNHVAEVKTMNVTEDLSVDIASSKDENLRVIERSTMLAPPIWLEPRCLYFDPGVFLHVEKVDVIEYCSRLTSSDNTEVILINYSRCVASSWCWRLLPFDSGEQPYTGGYIEDKHVIEELARITTPKDVEAPPGSSLFGEVKKRVAGARSGKSH